MKAKRTSRRTYADTLFRRRIRDRDRICQAMGEFELVCSLTLEVAHFLPRRALSVRWDADNAALLCTNHHRYLDTHPIEKHEFFQNRLGDRFDALRERHNVPFHKDYDTVIAGLK